jgi:hypothetical protein
VTQRERERERAGVTRREHLGDAARVPGELHGCRRGKRSGELRSEPTRVISYCLAVPATAQGGQWREDVCSSESSEVQRRDWRGGAARVTV